MMQQSTGPPERLMEYDQVLADVKNTQETEGKLWAAPLKGKQDKGTERKGECKMFVPPNTPTPRRINCSGNKQWNNLETP